MENRKKKSRTGREIEQNRNRQGKRSRANERDQDRGRRSFVQREILGLVQKCNFRIIMK